MIQTVMTERRKKRNEGTKSLQSTPKSEYVYTVAGVCCALLTNSSRHKRQKRVESSEESINESGDEEEEWVERRLPKDGDDGFIGPVPEIKVQATATKKE